VTAGRTRAKLPRRRAAIRVPCGFQSSWGIKGKLWRSSSLVTVIVVALLATRAFAECSALNSQSDTRTGGSDVDLKSHVVELQDWSGNLLGAGIALNQQGLILTAKHVVLDNQVSDQKISLYFAEAKVVFHDFPRDSYNADLVAVHPFLDLAVLQAKGKFQAPFATEIEEDPASLDGCKGESVTIIGHVQSPRETYVEDRAQIDEVDRQGYLILNRLVPTGTSGGPVFLGQRVIGVVSNTGSFGKSYIVPISRAVNYLSQSGITIKDHAAQIFNLADLGPKVETLSSIIDDIERDFIWEAELSRSLDKTKLNLALQLTFKRRLRVQPPILGRLDAVVRPNFGVAMPKKFPDPKMAADLSSTQTSDSTVIAFQDFDKLFETYLIDLRNGGASVTRGDLTQLTMLVTVHGMEDPPTSKTLRKPDPIHLCFLFNFKGKLSNAREDQWFGTSCSDQLADQ
jgi:hypothetical protein